MDGAKKALGGGLTGAAAMVVQVTSLMWLRTAMNYQYRNGGTMMQALKKLYAEGGIPRLYRGMLPALVQAPLSRFGDTAANVGALALLEGTESTKNLPVAVKTLAASVGAALFRMLCMPIDTLKTFMQVEGSSKALAEKMQKQGVSVLFHGTVANSLATLVGHYPWFASFNILDAKLPKPKNFFLRVVRNGSIGLTAAIVSDLVSNSLRVVKTFKQTSTTSISYPRVVSEIIKKDGVRGLFFRGIGARLTANCINSVVFTIVWKILQEQLAKRNEEQKKH